jgi:hypothetical protein
MIQNHYRQIILFEVVILSVYIPIHINLNLPLVAVVIFILGAVNMAILSKVCKVREKHSSKVYSGTCVFLILFYALLWILTNMIE